MPIFMDRHNVKGVTAEEVAMVHREDLKVQEKYDCRALTYWFDEERGTAFCLIEAPDKKAVQTMHDDAHGLMPHRIIEVDSSIVEAFLGRIEDPESSSTDFPVFEDSAFRFILIAELKDAALLLSETGSGDRDYLSDFRKIIQTSCRQHNGQIVQSTYDGFVATFSSVSNSVDCAVSIQKQMKDQNGQDTDRNIYAGIGIHAGEPVSDSEEFFGNTIRLAERLSYISAAGEVRLSSIVREQYKREKRSNLSEENLLKWLNPKEEHFLNRLMDATGKIWNRENFKVSDLCREIGVSQSQLYRRITGLTGQSPTAFMKEFRLKKAIGLIEKQPQNITRVAYETGFNNPSYFAKCFRKRFGLLPSEYRNRIS